jgi:hypothetical protein
MDTIESKSVLLKGSDVRVQRIKVNLSSGSQGWYVMCSAIPHRTQLQEDLQVRSCLDQDVLLGIAGVLR